MNRNLIQNIILVWCLGVVYSLLFPLFGGWMSFYFFSLSLVQSFLFSTVILILFLLIRSITNKPLIVWLTILLAMILHFGYWGYYHSGFSRYYWGFKLLIVTGVSLNFLLLIWLIARLEIKSTSVLLVTVLFGIILIFGKGFVVSELSPSFVSQKAINRFNFSEASVFERLYPLSKPLSEVTSNFSFLLPSARLENGVFVVVLDALREDFVGGRVEGEDITPNIQELARDGTKFERYYVQSPWTGSSTASLFTGLYPHEHGLCTLQEKYGQKLPDEYDVLAERYNSKGYLTIGATIGAHISERLNFNQGFDVWVSADNDYRGDLISLQEILFVLMRKNPEKFFVYFHMKGPHAPYQKGLKNYDFWESTRYFKDGKIDMPKWQFTSPGQFRRKKFTEWSDENPNEPIKPSGIRFLNYLYASQLNLYDEVHLKRLFGGLKALGLYKPSLITVTGDHGESLLENEFFGDPPRQVRRYGHLRNLSERVINTSLVLKVPDQVKNRLRTFKKKAPIIESVDLSATLLDYSGISPQGLSGRSFVKTELNYEAFQRAIAETCHLETDRISDDRDLDQLDRSELQKLMGVSRAAYPGKDWKLLQEFRKEKSFLYNLNKPLNRRKPVDNHRKLKRMKKEFNDLIQGDTSIKNPPGPFISRKKESVKELMGLGYF